MNGRVVDQHSITLSSTHAARSTGALALPAGHLITTEQRRHLLQSECVFVRAGQRVIGLAAYQTADNSRRMARHLLVDRSLDPPTAQVVLDILIMSLEMTALRDDMSSLTLMVRDRAVLPRLPVHGYRSVFQNSHEVWVQKTVCDESGDSAV